MIQALKEHAPMSIYPERPCVFAVLNQCLQISTFQDGSHARNKMVPRKIVSFKQRSRTSCVRVAVCPTVQLHEQHLACYDRIHHVKLKSAILMEYLQPRQRFCDYQRCIVLVVN
mmetsp:Transcript_25895/g.65848  ORF Transcript_25895/g.65848 Transcript_25895/m.65848 type:complete len:114 (-) Transcript_25895:202-543(-)